MNKYRDKSDFEINKAVTVARGYKVTSCEESVMAYIDSGYKPFDPCNNPADAMPIVIENRIMLNPYCADDLWKCEVKVGTDDIFNIYAVCYDKNPYRAAMEVFLMMKDAENEKS